MCIKYYTTSLVVDVIWTLHLVAIAHIVWMRTFYASYGVKCGTLRIQIKHQVRERWMKGIGCAALDFARCFISTLWANNLSTI
jgi:hypothetical protein